MKKFLLLLLPVFLWAQSPLDIPDRLSYVAQPNGSTQDFRQPNPVNMALNGAELITVTTTFDDNVTGWLGDGATLSHNTNADRVRTGAGSARIVTASPPSANSGLRISSAVSNATTNKFTWKAWVYVPSTDSLRRVRLRFNTQTDGVIASGTVTTIAANTWTELVLNAQAPGTQTGFLFHVDLFNGGLNDTLFVDDISLTQAYGGLVAVWFYANNIASNLRLLGRTTNGTNSGFEVFTNTSKFTAFSQAGPAFTGNAQSQTLTSGRWHFGVGVINRTDSIRVSANGEALTGAVDATTLGKITPDTVFIGSISGTSQFWNGRIGELIYVRYSTLPSVAALNAWIAFANTQRFIPEPPGGGTVVLRLFGKENSAYDRSGTQGVLTNTGNTPIIPR